MPVVGKRSAMNLDKVGVCFSTDNETFHRKPEPAWTNYSLFCHGKHLASVSLYAWGLVFGSGRDVERRPSTVIDCYKVGAPGSAPIVCAALLAKYELHAYIGEALREWVTRQEEASKTDLQP